MKRIFEARHKKLGKAIDKRENFGYSNYCPFGWAHMWRRSSVGQSTRFIPVVSLVRIQSPLPFCKPAARQVYIYGPLVKWLRHRPFTAVTRVRVSYGSPKKQDRVSGPAFLCPALFPRPAAAMQSGSCGSLTLTFLPAAADLLRPRREAAEFLLRAVGFYP